MAILDLFIAASIPVLKVLLVTSLGSFLALDHINIMGDDARKHMNKGKKKYNMDHGRVLSAINSVPPTEGWGEEIVAFFVFFPAIVASNLAKSITYESMMNLWFLPLNVFLTYLIGSVLGWLLVKISRPPSHLRGLIFGCCAAGNLGPMLIIIIPAVCREKGSPFGAPDVCSTHGLAYSSLSMAIGAIFLWSYVYNIVRVYSRRDTEGIDDSTNNSSEKPSKVLNGGCTEPLLSKDLTVLNNHADRFSLPCTTLEAIPQVPISVKFGQCLKMLSEKINYLKEFLTPSTIAAIAGFFVGVVPQIRRLMIGESAPLRVFEDSASLLGEGAIPAITLIMGANLLRGLKGSDIRASLIVGIIVVRYILLPSLGILIIKWALHFGLVHPDPLYMFILRLQFAVPPAMNIGTITQLFGTGERECSVIMLWAYGLASVSLTLWSTYFMWLAA